MHDEGQAFRVLLPDQIKVHNVFHPGRHPLNPLPGQRQEALEPVKVDGEYEYELDKIKASRYIEASSNTKWIGLCDDCHIGCFLFR